MKKRLLDRLGTLQPGWMERDVVSAGVVADLASADGRVTVTLDPGTARIGSERNTLVRLVREAMEKDGAVEDVRVQWRLPQTDVPSSPGISAPGSGTPPSGRERPPSRPMTPLQAELLEEGTVPEPDALGRRGAGPRSAPAAGYESGRPSPLPGPSGGARHEEYEGDVPVFQWEIDPLAPDRSVGEADLERDGWEHRIWWQVHPRGLAYASIQALPSADAPGPSAHPVGRAVAVNLVYDLDREAVVAVYGTAGDFRPFVSVFLDAFTASEGPSGAQGETRSDHEDDESEETI